ncbi:MAG: DUF6446 family protein [Pseudomonadota bacterium]
MNGKVVGMVIVASGLIAGAAVYYLQLYGFYTPVEATNVDDVQVTTLSGAAPEPILYENFNAIDAESSPIRYRACFTTPQSLPMMTETYALYDDAVPLNAPGWFDCFDADAIADALDTGAALAFLGTFNVHYGIDRIVAVHEDGRGWAWHQINHCGEEVFDGNPPPEGCPPVPERTN